MDAIVLAGGFGTRLKSVVSDVPKPMAPINNKPFLEYLLAYLKKKGISKVILAVGHKWQFIKEYFGEDFSGLKIIYSIEDEPLGTGGAIKKAIGNVLNDRVYIINGDTFFDVDLDVLSKQFEKYKADLVVALKTMHDFDRYGCVESVNDRVIRFTEKKYYETGNINGGVYLLNKNVFEKLPNSGEKFSFERMLEDNVDILRICAVCCDDYFVDIGIPSDYMRAQNDLIKRIWNKG